MTTNTVKNGEICKESTNSASVLADNVSGGASLEECMICLADAKPESFIKLTNCSHRFCRDCVRSFVRVSINESRPDVGCPGPGCKSRIHPDDTMAVLDGDGDAEMREKYERFSVRSALLEDPDSRWCPGVGCNYAVVAPNCGDCPQLSCARKECGEDFCYTCKHKWHPGSTCAEQEKVVLGKTVKLCPHCAIPVFKDEGCNVITCSGCGWKFCWICGVSIDGWMHFTGRGSCPYYGERRISPYKRWCFQIGLCLVGLPAIPLIATALSLAVIPIAPAYAGAISWQRTRDLPIGLRIFLNLVLVLFTFIAALVLSVALWIVVFSAGFVIVYCLIPISFAYDFRAMDDKLVQRRLDEPVDMGTDRADAETTLGTNMDAETDSDSTSSEGSPSIVRKDARTNTSTGGSSSIVHTVAEIACQTENASLHSSSRAIPLPPPPGAGPLLKSTKSTPQIQFDRNSTSGETKCATTSSTRVSHNTVGVSCDRLASSFSDQNNNFADFVVRYFKNADDSEVLGSEMTASISVPHLPLTSLWEKRSSASANASRGAWLDKSGSYETVVKFNEIAKDCKMNFETKIAKPQTSISHDVSASSFSDNDQKILPSSRIEPATNYYCDLQHASENLCDINVKPVPEPDGAVVKSQSIEECPSTSLPQPSTIIMMPSDNLDSPHTDSKMSAEVYAVLLDNFQEIGQSADSQALSKGDGSTIVDINM